MCDEAVCKAAAHIPVLKVNVGPRDPKWNSRLMEEYGALIKAVELNKASDNDWFRLEANKEGTRWSGVCWFIHELLKYELQLEVQLTVTYPKTAPDLILPELEGKTAKMFSGGKICLTEHFHPLWARNCPRFGIAHALALGLGPWLAVEIPDLISKGLLQHTSAT